MTLKKMEKAIKLMKAQVMFLATQQKERKSINKKIIAYARNVARKSLKRKTNEMRSENELGNTVGSGLTFQVYLHLHDKR